MNNLLKLSLAVSMIIAATAYAVATTPTPFVAVFPDGGVIRSVEGNTVCTIPNNAFIELDRNGPLEYMYGNRGLVLNPNFGIFSDGYED